MNALEAKIMELLDSNIAETTMTFNQSDYQIISQIHDLAEVLDKHYDGNDITIRFRMNSIHADRLKKVLARKSAEV